jgi:cold shock CspA family protein
VGFAGTGTVISWNDAGYGFIRDDTWQERDLYAHAKDIRDGGARRVSARVTYQVSESPKGMQALNVRLLPARPAASPPDECDVLTEEELRAELAGLSSQMVSVAAFVAAARRHGWVDG